MDPPSAPLNMLTPPASTAAPSTITNPLPKPRRNPVKPGSAKETEVISFLDTQLIAVQRKIDNRKYWSENDAGVERAATGDGYTSFKEAEKHVRELVDVVWITGSPKLQIPYLLTLANTISGLIPVFPPAPRATLRILELFDVAFSSLLTGRDADTGEPLPGLSSTSASMSITDKIRLRSIVEGTRVRVVQKLGGGLGDDADEEPTDTEDENMADAEDSGPEEDYVKFEGFEDGDEEDGGDAAVFDERKWEEDQIARVYERTISELGDVLEQPPIGMISSD